MNETHVDHLLGSNAPDQMPRLNALDQMSKIVRIICQKNGNVKIERNSHHECQNILLDGEMCVRLANCLHSCIGRLR